MKNYYQTLGVNRDASRDEIKSAYRKLAQKFHPDKNDGDEFFEERFKEIQEAYETLIDPLKKGSYDNGYDYFFIKGEFYQQAYSRKEEPKYESPKPDPEKIRREKEEQERKWKEKEEQEKKWKEKKERERVMAVKKNTELSFEDKAWIFLGNFFILPGAVGLWMFVKYKVEGYDRKSNTVCSLTIISFLVLLILTIFFAITKEVGY